LLERNCEFLIYCPIIDKCEICHSALIFIHNKKIYNLFKQFKSPLTPYEQAEYEILDSLQEKGMILAEKRCRKLRMGRINWSLTIQKACLTILYYKLSLARIRGKHNSSRYLIRLSKKTKVNAENLNHSQLLRKIHLAFKDYKSIRSQHKEL
jgi:hypothetical protein